MNSSSAKKMLIVAHSHGARIALEATKRQAQLSHSILSKINLLMLAHSDVLREDIENRYKRILSPLWHKVVSLSSLHDRVLRGKKVLISGRPSLGLSASRLPGGCVATLESASHIAFAEDRRALRFIRSLFETLSQGRRLVDHCPNGVVDLKGVTANAK